MLKPFKKVTVLYGHVHQIQYNQIDNISFTSAMARPWPYPALQAYIAHERRGVQLEPGKH